MKLTLSNKTIKKQIVTTKFNHDLFDLQSVCLGDIDFLIDAELNNYKYLDFLNLMKSR